LQGARSCWFSEASLDEAGVAEAGGADRRDRAPLTTLLALERTIRQRRDAAGGASDGASSLSRLFVRLSVCSPAQLPGCRRAGVRSWQRLALPQTVRQMEPRVSLSVRLCVLRRGIKGLGPSLCADKCSFVTVYMDSDSVHGRTVILSDLAAAPGCGLGSTALNPKP
jgi:hypothetical protein